METILLVNGCVRPESRTYSLAKTILEKLDGSVTELNLEKEAIEPLNHETLRARDMFVKRRDFSDLMFTYAKQFSGADVVVIAAPYWDLSFPAAVKAYIEAITVTGITFQYTADGSVEGLCRARKLIYVTTAGGSIVSPDYGFDYIKAMSENFYGIKDVVCFEAENLDIIGADVDAILQDARNRITGSIL